MKPPRRVSVAIDTREQKELKFPGLIRWWPPDGESAIVRLDEEDVKLPTADHVLMEWPDVACVERKGSMREVQTNLLTRDWKRFRKVLDRMAQFPYSCVFLDFSTTQLWASSRAVKNPERVLDALMRECTVRGISVLWVPPGREPRHSGELVVRWLLNAVYVHTAKTWSTRSILEV